MSDLKTAAVLAPVVVAIYNDDHIELTYSDERGSRGACAPIPAHVTAFFTDWINQIRAGK